MNILHVSCSPRGEAAESYRLARRIIASLLDHTPDATRVDRVIGNDGISHVDADYASAQHSADAKVGVDGSILQSEILIRELEQADVVVIGTPMHNLSVPSCLKAWIDHVVRARRTFDMTSAGKVGRLRDRPVLIAVSSGGRFSGARARQPDFLTPYLRTILGTIGLHDLTFFSVEGTGLGQAELAESRARAEQALQAYFSSFHLPASEGSRVA
jgi:FMN-dependent NADH-azoreductase